jgi:hypothetical protein
MRLPEPPAQPVEDHEENQQQPEEGPALLDVWTVWGEPAAVLGGEGAGSGDVAGTGIGGVHVRPPARGDGRTSRRVLLAGAVGGVAGLVLPRAAAAQVNWTWYLWAPVDTGSQIRAALRLTNDGPLVFSFRLMVQRLDSFSGTWYTVTNYAPPTERNQLYQAGDRTFYHFANQICGGSGTWRSRLRMFSPQDFAQNSGTKLLNC